MLLVPAAVGPVLLLWLAMSRVPRIRSLVALALVATTALAVALIRLFPRAELEIFLSSLVLAVATVVAARVVERRRLGPSRQPRAVASTHLLTGWVVVAAVGAAILWWPGPFYPKAERILPMPEGLRATVQPTDGARCGSGLCTTVVDVTGPSGRTVTDVQAQVREHVAARQWLGCRPVGWLLDPSTVCIDVVRNGDHVRVNLDGVRDRVTD